MSETPDSHLLSLDDLNHSGWQTALSDVHEPGYSAMHVAFFAAANDGDDTKGDSHRDALRFLGDLCRMALRANNHNEAFSAVLVAPDGRPMIPSDLSDHQLMLLAGFLPSVENAWLKGRLAHLVWLGNPPRDVSFALMTIDCYRSVPLDSSTWLHDGHAAWAHAIMLSKSLRATGASRLQEIERNLVDTVLSSTLRGEIPLLSVSRLLKEHELGKSDARDIASHLYNCANEISEDKEYYNAATYYQDAGAWYHIAHDLEKQTDMFAAEAEAYVAEGQRRLHSDSPSASVAASRFKDAIQAYRRVAGSERSRLGVDERIDELSSLVSATRREAVTDLKQFEITTDVSEIVIRVQDELRGTELPIALERFAAMVALPPYEQMQAEATAISEETLFTKLVNVSHMSSDGRVVGRRPTSEDENASIYEGGSPHDTFQYYQHVIGFNGGCIVEAARSVISHDHKATEQYFIDLADIAPMVPLGRAMYLGKGLFAGFVGDYVSALHLLIPQLEHIVRSALADAGLHTTSLDPSGVEHHKSLDTLLAFPEAETVLGKDLLETLKALLCDPTREGLRNLFAHGLLDDADFPWGSAAFLWGLTLSLAVRSLLAENCPIPDLPETKESPAQ